MTKTDPHVVAKHGGPFAAALAFVLMIEGGWSDRPSDRGGETFRGVSRKHWPNWPGWKLVDLWKKTSGRWDDIRDDIDVNALVADFYYDNFWVAGQCALLPPPLGFAHFDALVNHRPKGAGRILQRAVHATVDGHVGPQTLARAHAAVKTWDLGELLAMLQAHRVNHYRAIIREHPDQEENALGWFKRLFLLDRALAPFSTP